MVRFGGKTKKGSNGNGNKDETARIHDILFSYMHADATRVFRDAGVPYEIVKATAVLMARYAQVPKRVKQYAFRQALRAAMLEAWCEENYELTKRVAKKGAMGLLVNCRWFAACPHTHIIHHHVVRFLI